LSGHRVAVNKQLIKGGVEAFAEWHVVLLCEARYSEECENYQEGLHALGWGR